MGALVSLPVSMLALFFCYPVDIRRDADFLKACFYALVTFNINVLVAIFLIFYYTFFSRCPGQWQSLMALALSALKFATKKVTGRIIERGYNPDFTYGASYMTEALFSAFSFLVLSKVKETATFILMISIHLLDNLGHFIKTQRQVLINRAQRIQVSLIRTHNPFSP